MTALFEEFIDQLHIIAIIVSLAIFSFLRFGPGWITTLTKTAREMKERSDAVKNEYIATLEESLKRKEREIASLKSRLKKEDDRKD